MTFSIDFWDTFKTQIFRAIVRGSELAGPWIKRFFTVHPGKRRPQLTPGTRNNPSKRTR